MSPSRVLILPGQYVPVLLQSDVLYGSSLAPCASCGGELCVTVSGKCRSVSLTHTHPLGLCEECRLCQLGARVHNTGATLCSEGQASSRPAAECHTQSQCVSHGESTSVGGVNQPIRGVKSQSQRSTKRPAPRRGGLQAKHVCHTRVCRHARGSRAKRIILRLSQTHCR